MTDDISKMVYQRYPSPNGGSTAKGDRDLENCGIGQHLELFRASCKRH